ncbi:MAG: GGDEF domain-containing protein [Humidesulfovibrio sp.]|nr:GGDEF domain-containing protein [Humidesulfovibrio sp.]
MAEQSTAPQTRKTPGRLTALMYAATLVAIFAVLLSEFFVAYQLLADHPTHAPGLIKETYGAMLLGVALLAAQAVLVYTGLLRPVRENSLEIARLRDSLDQHCHHDELTKVFNRMAFDQMIVRELEGLKRYGAGFSAILVDIDGFRAVNDSLGYETGDQVLCELAQLLKQHMRKADCIFRWRSGRFLILASGVGAGQAGLFADKLRELVAGHGFRQGGRISITLGAAQAEAQDTPETFVSRVKTALSLAKDKNHAAGTAAEAATGA